MLLELWYDHCTSVQYTVTAVTLVQYTLTAVTSVQYTVTAVTSVQYTVTAVTSVQYTLTAESVQYTQCLCTSVPMLIQDTLKSLSLYDAQILERKPNHLS